MKRICMMLILLVVVSTALSAASYISGIPVDALRQRYANCELNQAVRLLQDSGYQVLHYNDRYVIAATPELTHDEISGSTYLCAYPADHKLYLVGKLPTGSKSIPASAGTMLLDLGSAFLLQSDLDDIELRELISHPFTLLDMEPLRIPSGSLNLSLERDLRTDIEQITSLVNATSVQDQIQDLQDFQTRYARADNRMQVANWIKQKFISYGVTNADLQPFTWQNNTQYNVVATITGTVYPDQYIIVGGHHDSISNDTDPYLTAPGADDNASGTVAALEMARVLMQSGYQPKTSIRFVTFAAEEFGLWGAKHYAQNALENTQNIRLMINHDMIANQTSPGQWQVRLMPYDGSLDHSAYAAQLTQQYSDLNPYYGSMNSGSSDSHPFWQRGYHVIYFFESDFCPYYHSSNDIVANINAPYAAEVIKASVACAVTFADMPAAPYDLAVRDNGDGASLLADWEGYNDASIAHYNVYYSTSMGEWGTPLTTSETSCLISGLTQGQLYYIAVSSVDTFGNESYMVYANGTPLTVPLEPQNFVDQPQFQAIRLQWNANSEVDLAGYLLYRSQAVGVQGDLIGGGPITTNSYLDTAVVGSQDFYYYSLCAIDNGGNPSPFAQVVKSRPLSFNCGVLVIDETENMSGINPFQPTDQQADDFYNAITDQFDVTLLDLNSLGADLRLADIGIYSSILWHGNDIASMDAPYFLREMLTQYIQAGGNILFSLYKPSMAFALNATYPVTFSADAFINDIIGIEASDFATAARFNSANPSYGSFPLLEVDPAKTITSLNGHILNVEGITPNTDCIGVYDYASLYENTTPQGAMNGANVGVLNLNQSGKVLTLSFPLYNMYESQARQLIAHVFSTYFNEQFSSSDDPGITPAPALSISANQPNPFLASTSFRIDRKDASAPLTVQVFNLRGQIVKTLFSGNSPKSLQLEWDGKDDAGLDTASGVYYIKAIQAGSTAQKRIARVK